MARAVAPWTWRRALRDHGPKQPGLLLTLYTIGTFMDKDGFAYPRQALLARGARASVRTVRRHIQQAQRMGWIGVTESRTGGQSWRRHMYRAAVPDSITLDEKDEALSDVITAQNGDIEPKGADTLVSLRF